jgi:hypothetical protein
VPPARILPKLHDCGAGLTKEEVRLGHSKDRISGAGEALSLALAHGIHVERLALRKFVESGNFSLNKLVAWWESA